MTDWAPVIAALVIIVGWGVSHWLAVDRDSRNRDAEMMTGFLVDAYKLIALYANRDLAKLTSEQRSEFARMLETAVATVQLFGTPEQINILHSAINQ